MRGYRLFNIWFIYSSIGVSLTAACTRDWPPSLVFRLTDTSCPMRHEQISVGICTACMPLKPYSPNDDDSTIAKKKKKREREREGNAAGDRLLRLSLGLMRALGRDAHLQRWTNRLDSRQLPCRIQTASRQTPPR
ncbi:hypothetical protein M441DRAFT_208062 [Trichoderma asperellum CBS 433.97]|uniref:Secreted protein n=1 Tax=Trichoderma asperellum (strain ATCC 204424 / CBS 433.97 / NBRC 101777) TaxID=1042311 RepID=A0A2T3ZMJ5_TRIA4|nr:hypothetical protein M441DRAFT_208062 [Trichoderma asperellum CBS 433.97]PTB46031.1 hypothetical protein M441DRAFT_208062 [Trichoderma asperellum CBS 433.97]